MSKNIIISTNKKKNSKFNIKFFKIDFNLNINNSPKMSLSSLNNDILIKIIETITEEKNNEIKKLQEELENCINEVRMYQYKLEENDIHYFKCRCCENIITSGTNDTYDWENCFTCSDGNADGLNVICGNCMDEFENNTDKQNEFMEEFTEYVVNITKCYYTNKKPTYKTYEEIPMCYKNSNMCIEKYYYNDWENFKNEEYEIEVMNGCLIYSAIHKNMIMELREVVEMNDIYLQSVLKIHRPKYTNGIGYCYDSDIHYRSIPIKTLLNVDWCKNKCEPRGMIGRSWWKRQGYNEYTCGCAYKSLTEEYKKKYLN
tara:strand:- start:219 stop:1163 length:945 start_codon:yes stop_codon:yes gene_type:complete